MFAGRFDGVTGYGLSKLSRELLRFADAVAASGKSLLLTQLPDGQDATFDYYKVHYLALSPTVNGLEVTQLKPVPGDNVTLVAKQRWLISRELPPIEGGQLMETKTFSRQVLVNRRRPNNDSDRKVVLRKLGSQMQICVGRVADTPDADLAIMYQFPVSYLEGFEPLVALRHKGEILPGGGIQGGLYDLLQRNDKLLRPEDAVDLPYPDSWQFDTASDGVLNEPLLEVRGEATIAFAKLKGAGDVIVTKPSPQSEQIDISHYVVETLAAALPTLLALDLVSIEPMPLHWERWFTFDAEAIRRLPQMPEFEPAGLWPDLRAACSREGLVTMDGRHLKLPPCSQVGGIVREIMDDNSRVVITNQSLRKTETLVFPPGTSLTLTINQRVTAGMPFGHWPELPRSYSEAFQTLPTRWWQQILPRFLNAVALADDRYQAAYIPETYLGEAAADIVAYYARHAHGQGGVDSGSSGPPYVRLTRAELTSAFQMDPTGKVGVAVVPVGSAAATKLVDRVNAMFAR